MAFIVNPVNPKVGVILTSPVFSAMYSPYRFFISPPIPHALMRLHKLICAEEGDTSWARWSSKMQRFDSLNYGFVWLQSASERVGRKASGGDFGESASFPIPQDTL
jgi:hypothetical protein